MTELFVNDVSTTLATTTTTGGTTLTITSATGLPTPTGGDFIRLRLEPAVPDGTFEIIAVTARSGTTLTVTRAQESTTGVAWAAGSLVSAVLTAGALATLVQSPHVFSAVGAAPGYYMGVDLDFDSSTTTLPESVLVRGRTTGSLRRAYWLNESGSPRAQAVKNEPAQKLYAPSDTYTGAILQLLTSFDGSGTQKQILVGFNATGPLLGPNEVQGVYLYKTGKNTAIPAGTPPCAVLRLPS